MSTINKDAREYLDEECSESVFIGVALFGIQ